MKENAKKHKILVVDDNKDFANIFCDILRANGHKSESCYSGKQALEMLDDNSYDVIFVDILMPDMNGVEVLRVVKQRVPETGVIMMTGYSMDEMAHKAIEEKALDVIHKPFDIEKVLSMIQTI
ncbi:MAG: response regulator [Candidatus Omnitrophica bacterium]|nr:response regulator [Candidatus Omnitrophota bacterium]